MTSNPTFPDFELCLRARELAFPQLRKFQSMYFTRPDMLICIDDLSALKSVGRTDFEDIFNTLVFQPRVEDVEQASTDFLHEMIRLNDGSWCAYSTIGEDPEYLKQTGRQDTAIRAIDTVLWRALLKLWIAVEESKRGVKGQPESN